jgi:hypothetical protein
MNNVEHKPSEEDAERCLKLRKLSRDGIKLNKEDHSFVTYMIHKYLEWFLATNIKIIKGSNVMDNSNNKIGTTRILEVKPELIDSALEYLTIIKRVYDSYKEAARIAVEKYNDYIEIEKDAWNKYNDMDTQRLSK